MSLFVAPKAGLKILDPNTLKPLPATGAEVPDTAYWRRRLRDGDVVEGVPAAPAAASPEQKGT